MHIFKYTLGLFFLFLFSSLSIAQSVKGIKEVDDFVMNKIKEKRIAGAVVLIAKDQHIIHHHASGFQDLDDKIKMDTNSIFRIYSMTKPITSVGIMILAERNLLHIDDPIGKYIPELADLEVLEKNKKNALKRQITIRDLLRHTAGFTYGFFSKTKVDKLYQKQHPLFVGNNEEFIDRVAKLPLLNQPGEKHHYSIATDILGVLIERICGVSLEQFLQENIFTPLEMKDTYFKLPATKMSRFCTVYNQNLTVKENYQKSIFLKKQRASGGGGLVSTSSDYLNFCLMLTNKGVYKNDTIISPSTIEMMTKNQLKDDDSAFVGVDGIGFGLGFSVQLKEWDHFGHIGDYGWSGAASTHFFISPTENLIVIILSQIQPFTNQLQGGLKPIIFKHH